MQEDKVNARGNFLRLTKWYISKFLILGYAVNSSKMPSKRSANSSYKIKTDNVDKAFVKKTNKEELWGISVQLENFLLCVSLNLKENY